MLEPASRPVAIKYYKDKETAKDLKEEKRKQV
jgi:hypothetical protein